MSAELEKWLKEEYDEGYKEGVEQYAELLRLLLNDNRLDDFQLVLDNIDARKRLYKEYHNIIWNKIRPDTCRCVRFLISGPSLYRKLMPLGHRG